MSAAGTRRAELGTVLVMALAGLFTHRVCAATGEEVRAPTARTLYRSNSGGRSEPDEHGVREALRAVYARNNDTLLASKDRHPTPEAIALLGELSAAGVYGSRRLTGRGVPGGHRYSGGEQCLGALCRGLRNASGAAQKYGRDRPPVRPSMD
jgi:hypothetical protein